MSARETYRTLWRNQLEYGIKKGIIDDITINDIEGVLDELESNPNFYMRMAKFLNNKLED